MSDTKTKDPVIKELERLEIVAEATARTLKSYEDKKGQFFYSGCVSAYKQAKEVYVEESKKKADKKPAVKAVKETVLSRAFFIGTSVGIIVGALGLAWIFQYLELM